MTLKVESGHQRQKYSEIQAGAWGNFQGIEGSQEIEESRMAC